MGFSNVVTPVTPSYGNDGKLGDNDGTSDSGCYFLGALHSQSNVSIEITDGDESLESSSLTGRGLLLNGSDGHDFILEGGEELVDDLEFLDGKGEKVDFFHRLDLSIVY